MRKPPSDCRTASLYKGEILCLPYRGTSDFIRLLSFSEKPPVLQFCAYGFLLPVQRCKKHLKPVALFGGLSDTDAAAASFAHENKHPLRCKFPLCRIGIYKRLPGQLPGLAFSLPLGAPPFLKSLDDFAVKLVPMVDHGRVIRATVVKVYHIVERL